MSSHRMRIGLLIVLSVAIVASARVTAQGDENFTTSTSLAATATTMSVLPTTTVIATTAAPSPAPMSTTSGGANNSTDSHSVSIGEVVGVAAGTAVFMLIVAAISFALGRRSAQNSEQHSKEAAFAAGAADPLLVPTDLNVSSKSKKSGTPAAPVAIGESPRSSGAEGAAYHSMYDQ